MVAMMEHSSGTPFAPRILVVDDDDWIREMIGELLTGEGHAVQLAPDGTTALSLWETSAPGDIELILLDVEMPDVDGFEVCRQLHAGERQPPPVLFLTGRAATVDRVKGLDIGAVDYMVKPFDPDELRARVRAAKRTDRRHAPAVAGTLPPVQLLSGELSRLELNERVRAARNAAAAGGPTLLMLEVDHLDHIRQSLGSVAADAVLVAVSERVSDVWASVESARILVGRASDGTFMLLVGETPAAQALKLAEDLRHAVAALPVNVGQALAAAAQRMGSLRVRLEQWPGAPPFPLSCTASVGVAAGGESDLVTAAAEALDRARLRGRDRVVLAPAAFRQIWANGGGPAASVSLHTPRD